MPNRRLCLKEHLAALEREETEARQKRNAFANKPTNNDVISDQEMVDKIFGFLPSMIGGQEGRAPLGFEVQSYRLVVGHVHPSCTSVDFVVIPSVVNSVQWPSVQWKNHQNY